MISAWDVLADAFDPPPFDPTATWGPLGYVPNPGPQSELHALPLFTHGGPWDVLYGGAAFGGKSLGLLMDAFAKASQWPGLEVWLVRATYPQLYDSFIGRLEKLGFGKAIGARWNGSERILRLRNRSQLKFRHARNVQDAAEMLSAECQYLIVDERTRVDPEVVDQLALRVRSGDPRVPVVGIRSGSNPGGPGHSTVKAAFIDPAPLGRQRLEVALSGGFTADRYFIPAKISDNPSGVAADPSYAARLDLLPDDMRAAYRDGDWSRFEGMRFADFSPLLHVIRPEQLPLDLAALKRGIGIDYGSAAPFAAIWGALVDDDRLVIYREAHETGLTPAQQGRLVIDRSTDAETNGHTPPAWVDPSTFARNPEAPLATASRPDRPPPGSIAARYAEQGLAVRKAHNDRVTGWASIDELLQPRDDGRPGVYIYDTCPNLIRSLSGAPRSDRDPEDVDAKYRDDHALDAFRYLVMGLIGGPRRYDPRFAGAGRRMAGITVPTGVR